MGANMDLAFLGYLHESADPLILVIGVSLGAVITQVYMVSNTQIQKRDVLYVRSIRIAGLLLV